MNNKYICESCNEGFETFQAKANHVRWNHRDPVFYEHTAKKLSILTKERNDIKYGKWIYESSKCFKCSNIVEIKYREGKRKTKYYCSRSCANSRTFNDAAKLKKSKASKQLWKNGHYDNTSAKNYLKLPKLFSSKNERLILDYFKNNFPDDKWTNGGGLKYKGELLSRDMFSHKLKVCFEYDGDWHFIDIKGQLENKQHKDQLLEDWCKDNNYRLIRIDEKFFINCEQVVELIYNRTEPIIKIGNRYLK